MRNLKSTNKDNKGFTIIEVMIVLAIAGLIMLIVFLAVPALQRNSRNTQRRNDAARLQGLVSEFTSNNNGKLPTAYGTSPGQMDITNENWSIMATPSAIQSGTSPVGTLDTLVLNTEVKCENNVPAAGAGARAFTVTFSVETSSGEQAQCV